MSKWLWFFISAWVIVIDQVTKYLANTRLELYHSDSIFPAFNLTLAYNTGIAFSFFNASGPWHQWILTGFSLIMSILLFIWMIRLPKHDQWQLFALSLILGGAIGNLMDRMMLGYVIDFIDIYYKNYHWPIFNIADSAISIGTVIIAIHLSFSKAPQSEHL